MLGILTEALSTKDVRLKRRCMACLGELLFYVAAMPGEAHGAACWDVQGATLSAIVGLLHPAEDSTLQVLAASALLVSGMRTAQIPHCLREPILAESTGVAEPELHACRALHQVPITDSSAIHACNSPGINKPAVEEVASPDRSLLLNPC